MAFSRNVLSVLILAADWLTIFACGLGMYLAYLGWNADAPLFLAALIIGAGLVVISLHASGAYRLPVILAPRRHLGRLTGAYALAFLLMVALAFALKISDQYSRVWLFGWLGGGLGVLLAQKAWLARLLRRLMEWGVIARKVAVFGYDERGMRLLTRLDGNRPPWMHLVGVFDDRSTRLPAHPRLPVLGTSEDLIRYAQTHGCDDILVTLPLSCERRLAELIRKFSVLPTTLHLVPALPGGVTGLQLGCSEASGIPLIDIEQNPLAGWKYAVKWLEDKLLASLILVLISPLMLLIAVAIKLDSPGPVLFVQRRIGFNNKPFNVYKFRTMRADAADPDARRLVTRDDPRVTRLGRFLRRTSLDELPQFFNVLKGDMSIVGPRPHALHACAAGRAYQEAVAEYAHRHKVKPGITGWAQVNGWRGETDTLEKIRKRVEYDLYYIDHFSLWLDLKIIARTVLAGFTGQNAY